MRFRIVLSILFLLASPLFAATSSTGPLVHAGMVEVDADAKALSFLPVDTGAVGAILCSGGPLHDWGPVTPRGECDLSVSPSRLGFTVDDSKAGDGLVRVPIQASGWEAWQGSSPVASECGLWDVSMVLDPGREQPVSELALEPSPADPAQGVFAGEVRLALLFRFTNRDLGTSLEVPIDLPLELSGHWTTAPDGTAPGPGMSNLVLFAGKAGGEVSPFSTCGTWGNLRCPVCLTSPPQSKGGDTGSRR